MIPLKMLTTTIGVGCAVGGIWLLKSFPITKLTILVVVLSPRVITTMVRVRLKLLGSPEAKHATVIVDGVDSLDFSTDWPDWRIERLGELTGELIGAHLDTALIRPRDRQSPRAMLVVPGLGRVFTSMPLQATINTFLGRSDDKRVADICGIEFPWYGTFFDNQKQLLPYLLNEWDADAVFDSVVCATSELLKEYQKVTIVANSSSAACLLRALCHESSGGSLATYSQQGRVSILLTNPALCFHHKKNPVRWFCDRPWLAFLATCLIAVLGCGALIVEKSSESNWYYFVGRHKQKKACFCEPGKVLSGRPREQLKSNPKRLSYGFMMVSIYRFFRNSGRVSLAAAYGGSVRIAITKSQRDESHIDVEHVKHIAMALGIATIPVDCHEPELHNDEDGFSKYLQEVFENE